MIKPGEQRAAGPWEGRGAGAARPPKKLSLLGKLQYRLQGGFFQ